MKAVYGGRPSGEVTGRHFLASQSLPVPQKVSLICMESEPVIGWCVPTIAKIQLKFTGVVRHIMSWLKHISQGRKDVRQHTTRCHPPHFSTAVYNTPDGQSGGVPRSATTPIMISVRSTRAESGVIR